METIKAVFFGPDPQAQVSHAALDKYQGEATEDPANWSC